LLPFFPRGFIGVDRLSGRYCVPQTVDQSERRTNELRQTVGKTAVKVTGERRERPRAPLLYEFAALLWFTGD